MLCDKLMSSSPLWVRPKSGLRVSFSKIKCEGSYHKQTRKELVKVKHLSQRNRTDYLEINSHTCSPLVFSNGAKVI